MIDGSEPHGTFGPGSFRSGLGIVLIAGGMAVCLMTIWGRVSGSEPMIAGSQTLLIGVVMSVGASLGDVLPESGYCRSYAH
ncbi:MAG: hypothetical protein V5A62_07135 [Haloarculaceae archaeon]